MLCWKWDPGLRECLADTELHPGPPGLSRFISMRVPSICDVCAHVGTHVPSMAHPWKSEDRFGSWFSPPTMGYRVQTQFCTASPVGHRANLVCACLLSLVFFSLAQVLNEYFHNVCELDLVFNFYKVGLWGRGQEVAVGMCPGHPTHPTLSPCCFSAQGPPTWHPSSPLFLPSFLAQVYTVVDEMFLAGEIRETSQTKVLKQLLMLQSLE